MRRLEVVTPDGEVLGHVEVEVPEGALLDLAITPVVAAAPGEEPRLIRWLASPRTTLDRRPRSGEHPYEHVGSDP